MKRHLSLASVAISSAAAIVCLFSLYFTSSETREQLLVAMLGSGIALAALAAVEFRSITQAPQADRARLGRFLPFSAFAIGALVLLLISSIGIFNSSMVAVGARESVLLAVAVATSFFAIRGASHLRALEGASQVQ